jgi:hypothetical protein
MAGLGGGGRAPDDFGAAGSAHPEHSFHLDEAFITAHAAATSHPYTMMHRQETRKQSQNPRICDHPLDAMAFVFVFGRTITSGRKCLGEIPGRWPGEMTGGTH